MGKKLNGVEGGEVEELRLRQRLRRRLIIKNGVVQRLIPHECSE
jgi:hypothetical protein